MLLRQPRSSLAVQLLASNLLAVYLCVLTPFAAKQMASAVRITMLL